MSWPRRGRSGKRFTWHRGRQSGNPRRHASAGPARALAGTVRANLPEKPAQKLKKQNPNLTHLTGALRRRGFVPK
jgi:hypothetical protein